MIRPLKDNWTFKLSWRLFYSGNRFLSFIHNVCWGMFLDWIPTHQRLMVFEFYHWHTPGTPYCTQWYPSSGHAVICQPWSLWCCGSEQVWFVTRRSHKSRRFIPYLPTVPRSVRMMGWTWSDGGGGRTARYWSRNSPETKRLFFAGTEEVCMCSLSLRQDNRPRLPSFVFWWFRFVLCFRKYRETTGILYLYCHNGSSWLGLTCRQPELHFLMCLAWGCVTVSFQI